MRLTSRSFALFLSAITVQSFAPLPGRTSPIGRLTHPSSSLSATEELSSLLNEYKSGATAADLVISSPVSTTTSTVTPSDVEANMNAAVNAASSAADQAAQAAAAAMVSATKSAAAVKVAAISVPVTVAAGVPVIPVQTLPDGVQVLPSGFQVRTPEKMGEISKSIESSLAPSKANFMSTMDSLKDRGDDVPSIDFDINSFNVSPVIPALIDSLHLKEYGGWYAAAAMAIAALQQRSAGKEEASERFESELELAREKANEAASAAGVAAEGAKMAKSLAMKMKYSYSPDNTKVSLEDSKMKVIELEKESMAMEIQTLQAKVENLESELSKYKLSGKKTIKSLKTEIEEEYPVKITMDKDPDEDARILEIIREIEEENKEKMRIVREQLDMEREKEAKFVALQKAKAEEEAAAAELKAEAEKKAAAEAKATAEKLEAERVARVADAEKMAREVEAAQAVAEEAKIKSVAKGADSKKATEAASKKSTKKTTTSIKTRGKSASRKSTKSSSSGRASISDWQSLSEATLKRKTVAEITEYLSEKGVRVTDDSGKVYKKADLVAAVKSL